MRFLEQTAPGCIPDKEHDSHLAANASSKALGCPIYQTNLVDEPDGSLWPMLKLAPAKFWIVPHHSGHNHVVVLHRFASGPCWLVGFCLQYTAFYMTVEIALTMYYKWRGLFSTDTRCKKLTCTLALYKQLS